MRFYFNCTELRYSIAHSQFLGVDHLATLHIPVLDVPVKDLRKVREGNYHHYLCKVNIEMRLRSGEAIFRVIHKHKKYGNVKIAHQA